MTNARDTTTVIRWSSSLIAWAPLLIVYQQLIFPNPRLSILTLVAALVSLLALLVTALIFTLLQRLLDSTDTKKSTVAIASAVISIIVQQAFRTSFLNEFHRFSNLFYSKSNSSHMISNRSSPTAKTIIPWNQKSSMLAIAVGMSSVKALIQYGRVLYPNLSNRDAGYHYLTFNDHCYDLPVELTEAIMCLLLVILDLSSIIIVDRILKTSLLRYRLISALSVAVVIQLVFLLISSVNQYYTMNSCLFTLPMTLVYTLLIALLSTKSFTAT